MAEGQRLPFPRIPCAAGSCGRFWPTKPAGRLFLSSRTSGCAGPAFWH